MTQQRILRAALALVIGVIVLCVADTILWHTRKAATDEVTVTQVSAAELKRNREEYYFDGDITISCARSILPQLTAGAWMPPCWYLRRNHIAVTRI